MITIISGKYRGRKLAGLKSSKVRPTLARVRKSMLQILEPFHGKKVLDLYSGVGTLGIEALSRGAESLTTIEKDYQVYNTLERNIITLCSADDTNLIRGDVNYYLNNSEETFDIIIADPPYRTVEFNEMKEKVKHLLEEGGVFCMEMKKTYLEEENIRIKTYGKTQVVFWRKQS